MVRLIFVTTAALTLAALISLGMPLCAAAQDGGQNTPKQKGLQQRKKSNSSF